MEERESGPGPAPLRRGPLAPPSAAGVLVGLRKAASVVHALPGVHLEAHVGGELRARVGRAAADGRVPGVAPGAPWAPLVAPERFRAGVAASTADDLGPAFAALGRGPAPLTLRLVGGPGATVLGPGIVATEGHGQRVHAFATTLPAEVLDGVVAGLRRRDGGGRVRTWVDGATAVALAYVEGPLVPFDGRAALADADLAHRAALRCAVAEVEHGLRALPA